MDMKRAKEIVQSSQKFNVNYQGRPVWIDALDETTDTARIHIENLPEATEQVSVRELLEQ